MVDPSVARIAARYAAASAGNGGPPSGEIHLHVDNLTIQVPPGAIEIPPATNNVEVHVPEIHLPEAPKQPLPQVTVSPGPTPHVHLEPSLKVEDKHVSFERDTQGRIVGAKVTHKKGKSGG